MATMETNGNGHAPEQAEAVPEDQLWFRHDEMRERLEAAEADLRQGRYSGAGTPEEAKQLLDDMKG